MWTTVEEIFLIRSSFLEEFFLHPRSKVSEKIDMFSFNALELKKERGVDWYEFNRLEFAHNRECMLMGLLLFFNYTKDCFSSKGKKIEL
jgi:hypothetical protein